MAEGKPLGRETQTHTQQRSSGQDNTISALLGTAAEPPLDAELGSQSGVGEESANGDERMNPQRVRHHMGKVEGLWWLLACVNELSKLSCARHPLDSDTA